MTYIRPSRYTSPSIVLIRSLFPSKIQSAFLIRLHLPTKLINHINMQLSAIIFSTTLTLSLITSPRLQTLIEKSCKSVCRSSARSPSIGSLENSAISPNANEQKKMQRERGREEKGRKRLQNNLSQLAVRSSTRVTRPRAS